MRINKPELYDAIIIGSGPAGLSAGIHLAQYGLKTVAIEKLSEPGGLARKIELVENYPGFPEGISGIDLTKRMVDQASRYDLDIRTDEEVINLSMEKEKKIIETIKSTYLASLIIFATGSGMQGLGIKNETWFGGGIFYCNECCSDFLYGKHIVVIGSSPEAIEEAVNLKKFTAQITVVDHAEPITFTEGDKEKLRENNISLIDDHFVEKIEGEPGHKFLTLKKQSKDKSIKIEADCVFIAAPLKSIVHVARKAGLKTHRRGCIIVDEYGQTNIEGVFAAGACTSVLKDIIPPCIGDGAKVAAGVRIYYLTKSDQ